MALMKGNKNSDDYKRHVRIEESGITGLLNFVVALAIAAVAYTDWIVVANVSLGYLYVLPIALSALVNPLPLTIALAVVCTVLQDIFGPPAASLPLKGRPHCGRFGRVSGGRVSGHADREAARSTGGRGAATA
jgi:hypothetical protein